MAIPIRGPVPCSGCAARFRSVANHVLDLDGSNSWVELPQDLFTNQIVTVEGWVKWRAFGSFSRFFQFGSAAQQLAVLNSASSSTLRAERYNRPPFDDLRLTEAPDALWLGEWEHIALVASTNGMRLYVNGVLATTNEAPFNWKPDPPPPLKNLLGRSLVKAANNANTDTDLNGQMDEVRHTGSLGERTEAQIRDNMFHPLTGTELGLLGWWNFESVANGVVKDGSPGGHDGRLMGNARVIVEPPPAPNRVLQLDGTNSYVELPPHILDGLKEATIEGWVKWRRFKDWPRFFTFGTGENRVGVMAGNDTNRVDLIIDEKVNPWVGQNIVSDNAMTAGEWVHVACVFTTNGTTLLINGRAAGAKPDVLLSKVKENTENFLGASPDLKSALDGQMDEVRIWKFARTEAQIREAMSKSLTGSEPGLVALWNFDDGTCRDVTGHGHDGILHGHAVIVIGHPAQPASKLPETPSPVIREPVSTGPEPVLDLDGLTGHVLLPAHILDGLQTVTIECWVKWRRFNDWPRAFTFGKGENEVGLMSATNNHRINLTIDEKISPWVGQSIGLDNAMAAGEWVHVASVFTTNGGTLFVNGRQADSSPSFLLSRVKENTENAFGSGGNGYGAFLDGQMDEVRIWKFARTEAQIRENMFKSLSGREAGLVSYGTSRLSPIHWSRTLGLANLTDASSAERDELVPIGLPSPGGSFQELCWIPSAMLRPGRVSSSPWTTSRISQSVADALGRYEIVTITPGHAFQMSVQRQRESLILTNLAFQPGEQRKLDLQLVASPSIAGRVKSTEGKPLPGVLLQLLAAGKSSTGQVAAVSFTGADGSYHFWGIEPGTYRLQAQGSHGFELYQQGKEMLAAAGSQPTNADFALEPMKLDTLAGPATSNQVLRLNSTNSYVELPRGVFRNLRETTIEAWVRFDSFTGIQRFFSYGTVQNDLYLGSQRNLPTWNSGPFIAKPKTRLGIISLRTICWSQGDGVMSPWSLMAGRRDFTSTARWQGPCREPPVSLIFRPTAPLTSAARVLLTWGSPGGLMKSASGRWHALAMKSTRPCSTVCAAMSRAWPDYGILMIPTTRAAMPHAMVLTGNL